MAVAELHAHLATGSTTVSRCWAVTRADGTRYGFTDHDVDLVFEGLRFRADTGLSDVQQRGPAAGTAGAAGYSRRRGG